MRITIGNTSALQAEIVDGAVTGNLLPLEGNRETVIELPDDTESEAALRTVVSLMKQHMSGQPAWIECDNEELKADLLGHWKLTPGKGKRPKGWKIEGGA